MNLLTPIGKVPKELRGIWNLQYRPIERVLQEAVNDPEASEIAHKNAKIYKSASIARKLSILDQLHMEATGVTSMF